MPGRRGRGQGHGRRGRWAGWLDPVMLLLLHHGPAHGYTLLSQLEPFGLIDVDPSIVYRALRDMEEQGLVTSSWDTRETQGPPRRMYQLTALGDRALQEHIQALAAERNAIDAFLHACEQHMQHGSGAFHEDE
ncbi:MAG: helix-turn-helix transcriptional regulator [Anaerolineales bacterium]|nr:helix-turn-helix transcriptional regulator [Anaerolineales bacterium]